MKFEIPWGEDIYDCEWFDETDFEKLKNVQSILGFIFDDDGKMCMVKFKDMKDWSLPGGHLEDYDENFEACLIRETIEEADLELKDIIRIGYMSAVKQGGSEDTKNHQLRYVARVHKLNEQTIDPAEGYIPERKFIDPSEFIEHVKWNSNGEHQLKRAIELLEKSKKRVAKVDGEVKMSKIKVGGWQVNVEYHDDHVIKTPKTKDEISEKITKYLKSQDQMHKLDELISKMQRDWEESLDIIRNSSIPFTLLAEPEFLEDGKIKQKKVVVLDELFEDLINKNSIEDAKSLVDDVIKFIIELWRYGIHEKTFKFYTEYGILNDKMVLIDFGEVTNDIEKVKKQILSKKPTFNTIRIYYNDKILDYFLEQRDKILTVEKLEKEWGKYLEKSKC